jgi:hypothetical protein
MTDTEQWLTSVMEMSKSFSIKPVRGNVMELLPVPDDGGPTTHRARYWFVAGWVLGPMDDVEEEGRPELREMACEILRKKKLLFESTPDMPGIVDVVRTLIDDIKQMAVLCQRYRKTFN